MMHRIIACVVLLSCATAQAADCLPLFRIPKLDGIVVDGDIADWDGGGLRVLQLADPEGRARDAADLSATLRVGWDAAGLLLAVEVQDQVCDEADGEGALYQKDSVEVFFSSNHFTGAPDPGWGKRDTIQPIFGPGFANGRDRLRHYVYDQRSDGLKRLPRDIEAARAVIPGGYRIETRLPWAALGIEPKPGATCGLQVQVNDSDADARPRAQILWNGTPGKGMRLLPADSADKPVEAAAAGQYRKLKETVIHVWSDAREAGKEFQVLQDGELLAKGALTPDGARASGQVSLPMPPGPGAPAPFTVAIDGRAVAAVELPDPAKEIEKTLKTPWRLDSPVFSGDIFPAGRFQDQEAIESLLEPGSLRVRWYDAECNECGAPKAMGRHGAIVSFKSKDGREFARRAAACRAPSSPDWSKPEAIAPESLGVNPASAAEHAYFWKGLLDPGSLRNDRYKAGRAEILASLQAAPPGADALTPAMDAENWWFHLEKKLGIRKEPIVEICLPKNYGEDMDRKWPLIVFLHGTGFGKVESARNEAVRKWLDARPDFPAILAQPLIPDIGWIPDELDGTLEKIKAAYRVDPARIALCGFSMGAIGCWHYAMKYPGKVSRLLPAAGYAESPAVKGMAEAKLPVWAFHGDRDGIPMEWHQMLVDALASAGGQARMTILPGVDHTNTTEAVFTRDDVYDWMIGRQPESAKDGDKRN